ncbi:hypothetical protein RCL_jg9694.t1 [Rhizophagus clarus]|uniref:Uncharacterized protein n=1 Tax=Rhizophagus clarus TaxID=94130 RepID=A0A8H3LUX7_9GLOM|nr:hypothetical protein RCL_jg9694.t1 [Rhizophagus clarus]
MSKLCRYTRNQNFNSGKYYNSKELGESFFKKDHFHQMVLRQYCQYSGVLYEIFCQFRSPVILRSDNGKEFTATRSF